jgi:type I restriction enzyme R subunit
MVGTPVSELAQYSQYRNPVFDSVIVVTDRKVLDKQIRDNIRQFAQVNKVVEAIEKGSKQLERSLRRWQENNCYHCSKIPFHLLMK